MIQSNLLQDHVSKGLKAVDWVKEFSSIVGGKSGGKDISAQGMGKNSDPEALKQAHEKAVAHVRNKLGIFPKHPNH